MHRRIVALFITVLAAACLCVPQLAFADDESGLESGGVESAPAAEPSENKDANDAADGDSDSQSNGASKSDTQSGANQEPMLEATEIVAPSSDTPASDSASNDSEMTLVEEGDAPADGEATQSDNGSPDSADANTGDETVSTEVDSSSQPESAAPLTVAAASAPAKAPAKAAAPTIKNGWYTIKSLVNTSYAIYVKGMKTKDGTKLQLKKGVTSAGYAFKFKKVGKYYRIIVGIATKESVQVLGVKNGSGGVVSINSKNSKKTLFKLKYNEALGGFTFVNAATRQALTVKGGKAKNGAKIVGGKVAAGSKAQAFSLVSRPGLVSTNIYSFKTKQKGKRALTASGSKAYFFKYTKDSDQKWYVAPVRGKKNVYVVECISTGKRLTGVKNKQVRVKAAADSNKAQWWVPSYDGKGITWKNYSTKKPLSTSGSKCAEGSKAMNKKYSSKNSRSFTVSKRTPVESGVYELVSGANARLDLEIAGASKEDGALAQVNTASGNTSQKWVYDASAHTLKNVNSGKLLEVRPAEDGFMLVQAASTGASTQKWTFAYAGGGKFQVVSGANANRVLSAVGNATAAATSSPNQQTNEQKWKVSPTSVTIQPKGFKLIKSIVNYGHGSLKATYIVIHETANPGATAKNHRDLWAGNGYYSDYAVHYVLDWTGNCYYCVPEDRLCWQVGNGNKYVVGIELCHATKTNKSDFNKVWNAGVQWAAWQLKKNGWGVDRMLSHNECRVKWGGTDHTDPDSYFEEFGQSWSKFKAAVKKALANY